MYIVKQKPSEPLFSSRGRGNCVRGRAPRLFCEPNLRDWSLTSHFRRPAPSLSRSDIDWGSQKRVVRAWSFTVRLCLPFLRPRTRRKRTMGGERGWGGGIGQKKFRVRRFLSVLQRDDPHRDEGIVQRRRISFGKKYISRSSRFFDVVKKLRSFALSSIFFVFFQSDLKAWTKFNSNISLIIYISHIYI